MSKPVFCFFYCGALCVDCVDPFLDKAVTYQNIKGSEYFLKALYSDPMYCMSCSRIQPSSTLLLYCVLHCPVNSPRGP
jgi:hypothetical protein